MCPTYYPGATDSSGAAPVDVAAGAQMSTGNLMLIKTPTVSVKGRVVVDLTDTEGLPSVSFQLAVGHDTRGVGRYRGALRSATTFRWPERFASMAMRRWNWKRFT
jgi:hypothetical protein